MMHFFLSKNWVTKRGLPLFVLLLLSATPLFAQLLQSPDQQVNLQFFLGPKGEPTYTLQRKQQAVIQPSTLGFDLKNDILRIIRLIIIYCDCVYIIYYIIIKLLYDYYIH